MQNFLDPAILFFVFGILAGSLKSNLEIPPPISRFLSLYLLMALGLKGGFSLAQSGLTADVLISLAAALAMATLVPVLGYLTLRRFLNRFDAAAIAATYGSVSAVTFITAVQYLDNHGISFGGHMAAAMALMESPAIVLAVVLANHARRTTTLSNEPVSAVSNAPLGRILHEALTDGAQLLLLGAMLIGVLTGESGQAAMKPFSVDLFKGMLAFFLLDMGLLAARNMGKLRGQSVWLLVYAIAWPLVHASIADGAGGQRLLYRRAGGHPSCHPRGQPVAVLRHVAGTDLSVQHPDRHTALCACGAAVAMSFRFLRSRGSAKADCARRLAT